MVSQPVALWPGPEPGSQKNPAPKLRGERTKRRIAEATLSLLEESEGPPTARDIAERAGVSLRLIFHHFEDLDALHDIVGTIYEDRFEKLALDVPSDLPLSTRVERTVRARARLFESIGNFARNATLLSANNPGMAARLACIQQKMIGFLESSFAPELRDAGSGRKELLAALDVATSWPTWDRMRRIDHLSVASSRRVMSGMLHSAIGTQ